MMVSIKAILLGAILAHAVQSFPSMALDRDLQHLKLIKRASEGFQQKRDTPTTGFEHRTFTTVINPDSFDYNEREQYVDLTSQQHKFIPPGNNDMRGPCPGLNLLANHGYLNRNGITNLAQAIDATNKVFGLELDFGTALVAYGVIFNGNILDQTFSIGGPYQSNGLGSLGDILLGKPGGLDAHNIYEGDASIVRRDYYEPGANLDNYHVYLPLLQELLDMGNNDRTPGKDVYNSDLMVQHKIRRWHQSVSRNPYFFSPPFASIVSTVAERFLSEFAANNTLDPVTGKNRIYLDEINLLPFFGVKRNADNSLTYTPGHERLLPSWHRRPLAATLGFQDGLLFFLKVGQLDPNVIAFGGNAGKVDTFTGINPADLTGGIYNAQTLLQDPQAMACFIYQAVIQQFIPTQLNVIYKDVGSVLNLVSQYIAPPFKKLANSGSEPCLPFTSNLTDVYSRYPGAKIETQGQSGIIGGLLGNPV